MVRRATPAALRGLDEAGPRLPGERGDASEVRHKPASTVNAFRADGRKANMEKSTSRGEA